MFLPRKIIVISVREQKLFFICDDKIKEYPVSTSRYGVGYEEGSFKTPLGLHRIFQKIGGGEDKGTAFVGRKPVSKAESVRIQGKDLITSRILWLEGIEQHNQSTLSRYIYIHGTDQKVGVPLSKGCIRMTDDDIIELFENVDVGDIVYITDG